MKFLIELSVWVSIIFFWMRRWILPVWSIFHGRLKMNVFTSLVADRNGSRCLNFQISCFNALSGIKVCEVSDDVLVELLAHWKLFHSVKYFMEGTKYYAQPSWFYKFLWINLVGVNVWVLHQRLKHLIVLLLDGIMKRSLSTFVKQIEIKDLPLGFLVNRNNVSQGLVLLLSQSDMNWSCTNLVDKVDINFSLQTLFEDFKCQHGVFVVLDKE